MSLLGRVAAWFGANADSYQSDELRRYRDEIVPKLESDKKALQHEKEKLEAVVERDLKRVEAETAVYCRKIVENES